MPLFECITPQGWHNAWHKKTTLHLWFLQGGKGSQGGHPPPPVLKETSQEVDLGHCSWGSLGQFSGLDHWGSKRSKEKGQVLEQSVHLRFFQSVVGLVNPSSWESRKTVPKNKNKFETDHPQLFQHVLFVI